MTISFGPLAYGAAPLGNLYRAITDEQAHEALQAAWDAGIRYFDTAPHYGLGLSERRLGAFLSEKPRDEFVVSTKVGRLLVRNPDDDGSGDLDRVFKVPGDLMRRFDMSEAGIRRSLDESLKRMGLDRVDIVYLHDPDVYGLERGLREGLPALTALRSEGVVREVGIGVNDTAAATRAVRDGDLDLVLIAGRYTLLEQSALLELFPACAERGVRVVSAAPFNSGLLATNEPSAGARYDYARAQDEVLARVRDLARVCTSFGVELPAAALRFPGRDPLVATTLVGMASADEVLQNVQRMRADLPDELWPALAAV